MAWHKIYTNTLFNIETKEKVKDTVKKRSSLLLEMCNKYVLPIHSSI